MSKARELSKLPNYVLSTVAELKLAVGKEQGDKAFIGGYYADGDGGGGDFYWDAASVEDDNGGTIFQVTGTTTGRWKRIYSGSVSVKWFGAVGDGVTNDTSAIQNAINYSLNIYIPEGVFNYSALSGLSNNNVKVYGDGSTKTTLNYTGSSKAINIDGNGAFIRNIHISGISIKGNANTTSLLYLRDVARSNFKDINVYEANNSTGVGFDFLGIQLNHFEDLYCSQDRQTMLFPPYIGLQLRVSSMLLNSTNNTFVSCYTEGGVAAGDMKIGMRLYEATQNTFIGGASESVQTYGLTIGAISSMNTFIGTGFESISSTADIADGGISNSFINCYSSKSVLLQGTRTLLQGGFFERIQIDAGSVRNKIDSLTINHWASGSGGLFDSGTGTISKNVYDSDTSLYKIDIKPSFLAYADASIANVTGNNNVYQLNLVEAFDDNNNFNEGTFTAPITGRYQLNAVVSLVSLSTSAAIAILEISTTARNYHTENGLNPKTGGLQTQLTLSTVAYMNAGDTAVVKVTVQGMAGNTVTVLGNATTMWTTFSGSLVS
jgi:hypothetical protein